MSKKERNWVMNAEELSYERQRQQRGRSLTQAGDPATRIGMDLRKLLTGDLNRLHYAQRYGTSLVLHPENVAEHSFYVGLYCFFIYRWCKQRHPCPEIELEKLLTRALVHDLDEAWSGDLPRPFKHSDPELRRMLEGVVSRFLHSGVREVLPGLTSEIVIAAWAGGKDDSYEGLILTFADFLSVVSHMAVESSFTNVTMSIHEEETRKYLAIFDGCEFDFIRPLVQEAQRITREILAEVSSRKGKF